MSIFLAVVIGTTSAYLYDRKECKRLQQEYIEKVKFMSLAPLESTELARRIKVYGARVPDDGELDRSSKWFKRYMRPILMASGTDYSLTTGVNPGGLGRTLVAEIRASRIATAAKELSTLRDPNAAGSVLEDRDAQIEAAALEGGIILLGRGALKEYLWALKRGYNEEIDLVEEARLEGLGLGAGERRKDGRWEREEEVMVRELERDDELAGVGPFDIVEPEAMTDLETSPMDNDNISIAPMTSLAGAYAPYRSLPILPSPTPLDTPSISRPTIPLPQQLPQQPPVLLVPFSHPFGVVQWPSKLLHFFNHRSDVRLGGDYALKIINAKSRPMESPTLRTEAGELQGLLNETLLAEIRRGDHKDLTMEEGIPTGSRDLDFSFEKEEVGTSFRKSYRTLPKAHEYSRRDFYTVNLPPKLAQARELAGGRTPTSSEEKNPPKMENELRKERLEKELKWRRELEGWGTRRSGSGISWDEKWGAGVGSENPFRVFVDLTEMDEEEMRSNKRSWEALEEDRKIQYELL